jgi:integrase/recombinase XerD
MPTLSLYKRIKTGERWKYERILEGRGHRTSDLAGPFYARPFHNGQQFWKTLSAETFAEARDEAGHLNSAFAAQAKGLTVAEFEKATNADRIPLKKAVQEFLEEAEKKKRPKTVVGYKLNLNQFLDSAKSLKFLDQVTKQTLREFRDYLSAQGYEPRTLHNRVMTVLSLLKEHRIHTGFSLTNDLPTFEEDPPVPFAEEELKKLFTAMTDEDRVRYKFFLGTACREQEVQFATLTDVDFERMEFHVRQKPDVGFTPKNHEKRTVPMPASLVALLKQRKKNTPHGRWIFVNRDGAPDGHFLKKLKRIALEAGLNCGECTTTINKGRYNHKRPVEVTCKTDPVCRHFFLHRLRKTCASRWEAAGIPVRTIQAWLGHKDLSTTQRYLGVTDSSKLRSKIDAAAGD